MPSSGDRLSMEIVERLARIEVELAELRGDVGRIDGTINGPPREGSLRDRLHLLESTEIAQRAVNTAMEAVRETQRRTFGTWEKIGLFGFAGMAAVASMLRLLGVGG